MGWMLLWATYGVQAVDVQVARMCRKQVLFQLCSWYGRVERERERRVERERERHGGKMGRKTKRCGRETEQRGAK